MNLVDKLLALPPPFWADESTAIFNADCNAILPLFDPARVNLLCTDPPYGIGFKLGRTKTRKSRFEGRAMYGDGQAFDPTPLLRFPRLVIFGANNFSQRLPPSQNWCVWDKRHGSKTDGKSDFREFELIWSNLRGGGRFFRHLWFGFCRASEGGIPREHPTQKPVALMRWLIERFSGPGDLILDPYMGAGTTLVAARQLGRPAIGIEYESRYCRAAVRRVKEVPLQASRNKPAESVQLNC